MSYVVLLDSQPILPIEVFHFFAVITVLGLILTLSVLIFFLFVRKMGYPRGNKEFVDDGINKLVMQTKYTIIFLVIFVIIRFMYYGYIFGL